MTYNMNTHVEPFLLTTMTGAVVKGANGVRNIFGNANLTKERAVDRANKESMVILWRVRGNEYSIMQGITTPIPEGFPVVRFVDDPEAPETPVQPNPEPVQEIEDGKIEDIEVEVEDANEAKIEAPKELPVKHEAKPVQDAAHSLHLTMRKDADPAGAAIAQLILQAVTVDIPMELIESTVKAAMAGLKPRIIQMPTMERVNLDAHHYTFETLLKVVMGCRALSQSGAAVDKWPYLVGPAGSGKTTAAMQVAKALGLGFGAISANPQVDRTEFFGFVSPIDGKYHTKAFVEIYRNGGVFLLDEIDAMAGDVLVAVNAAIRGTQLYLPNGVCVNKHADFVLIAGGNTAGKGATATYSSRQALDGATLDGFKFLQWGYDWQLMRRIYSTHTNLVTWVQSIADAIDTMAMEAIVSPRAISAIIADVSAGISMSEACEMCVWAGMEPSVAKTLQNKVGSTPKL